MENKTLHKVAYIAFIGFLIYSFVGNFRLFLKARTNLSQANTILSEKKEANQKLKEEIEKAGKLSYLETVARDTLGLAREKEVVFVLPPENELRELSPRYKEARKSTVVQKIPNWQAWASLFIPQLSAKLSS